MPGFLFNPYAYFVNRFGTLVAETTGVTVSDTTVAYSFREHAFARTGRRGTFLVNFVQAIPTGTTDTLPIVFVTNGVTMAVTKPGGEALTVADIAVPGLYEFYFDKESNTIQILTGVAATVTAAQNS